jgi:hypothetical protein
VITGRLFAPACRGGAKRGASVRICVVAGGAWPRCRRFPLRAADRSLGAPTRSQRATDATEEAAERSGLPRSSARPRDIVDRWMFATACTSDALARLPFDRPAVAAGIPDHQAERDHR